MIFINASGSISLDNSNIFNRVRENGQGNSGGIEIITSNLFLDNDSQINTSTIANGNGGTISIDANNSISLNNGSVIGSQVDTNAMGNSGEIKINTNTLNVLNSSIISSTIFGIGDAQSINIQASDSIALDMGFIENGVFQDAVGNAGGINITTTELSLFNGSTINVNVDGQGDAGAINIDARKSIFLDDIIPEESTGTGIFSQINRNGIGQGGDIEIKTTNLSITGGAGINTKTSGKGDAGNIIINANDSILISGRTPSGIASGVFSTVDAEAEGNGGLIQINTNRLTLADEIRLDVSSFGTGNAGAIQIEANDIFISNSEIFSTVNLGAIGNAGNIKISSNNFSLINGSVIDSSIRGKGNAGIIQIDTANLIITNQSVIHTTTFSRGNAGDIKIDASNNIYINEGGVESLVGFTGIGNGGDIDIITNNLHINKGGTINTSTQGIGSAGDIKIRAGSNILIEGINSTFDGIFSSGIVSQSLQNAIGSGGKIEINTTDLFINNGGGISTNNRGKGDGGDILIEAQSLSLNEGTIEVDNFPFQSTFESQALIVGGNINLEIADNIILRNNSNLSAEAGSNANGGNIDIDSKFIIAFPNQNNDIIASASQGRGGEINIITEGIFGLEERSSTPPNETNDIDASSQFGLSGEVNITRPDVDPASGLLDLTAEVVDPAELIAQNVCTQTADSEFVDIGKGGLPQNPQELLVEDAIEVELVKPIASSGEEISSNREITAVKPNQTRKSPAQGWIFHENGIVELVAHNPHQVGEQRIWDNYRGCQ